MTSSSYPTSFTSPPTSLSDDDPSLLPPPSDVSVAIDYLLRTFPHGPPIPHFLEPRLLLTSQLYAIVQDHTAVDVELAARARAGSIVMMRMRALGRDDFGFVRVEEYREIVEAMIDDKVARLERIKRGGGGMGADAAGDGGAAPVSLLAPNTRPIKRKRPGGEQHEGSKKLGVELGAVMAGVGSVATDPSPSSLDSTTTSYALPRPPPLSPVSSPNRLAHSSTSLLLPLPPSSALSTSTSDKENHTVPPRPPPSAARLSDEILLLRTALTSLVPHHCSPSISRGHLLALLTPATPYQTLTSDDVISTLFHHQLLLPSPDALSSTSSPSPSSPSSSFLLALPNISRLVREVLEGREALVRLVQGTRWKEMRRSELERKVRLKGTDRGVRWHLLEMLGGGRLVEVETTKGCMIRVPKTDRSGRKRS